MAIQDTPAIEAELVARAGRVFPGGVLGNFRLPEGLEIVAQHATGAYLYSAAGRRFIDYILGSGPLMVGHAHPTVAEAIARQASRGSTYYTLNEPAIELADTVLALFPANMRLMFTSSGSEATFYSMRLARAFTNRQMILKFAGAYHGHNDYSMPEAGSRMWEPSSRPVPSSAGVPRETLETVLVAEFNDRASVEHAFERFGDKIAAVIVEPYQRVLEPEPDFLPFLRSITSESGALLIMDEVVTGFRFHYGMAQDLYGIQADLTAIGKVIGGGLPMAAVVGREDIMTLADSRKQSAPNYVYFSGTLNGYALGAAAGLATLAVLRAPGAYDQLNHTGQRLRSVLSNAAHKYGRPAAVVGRGPMFHILFTDAPAVTRSNDITLADRGVGLSFSRSLIAQGILVNPWQRSYVSLAHSEEDVSATAIAIDRAFDELSRPNAHSPVTTGHEART